MLFTKSTVLFSALALCNVAIAAQPPACLLSIVGYVSCRKNLSAIGEIGKIFG